MSLFTWTDAQGTEHVLDADLIADFKDELSGTLTEHSVESGATIADHYLVKPEVLTFTLVQSRTPIVDTDGFSRVQKEVAVRQAQQPNTARRTAKVQPVAGFRVSVAGALEALAGRAQGSVSWDGQETRGAVDSKLTVHVLAADSESTADRVEAFHETLFALIRTKQLVTVVFRERAYANRIVTRVTRTQGSGAYGKANFQVELREFRTVTAQRTELPPDPAAARAAKGKNRGGQPEKDDPSKQKSILAAGADLF